MGAARCCRSPNDDLDRTLMALQNLFGGLALDETLKQMIAKFRDWSDPTWVTSHPDLPVHVAGKVIDLPDPTIGAVTSSIASVITAQVLAPQNNSRQALSIYNNSSSILYVLASVSGSLLVSSSFFTLPMAVSGYWELPQGPGGCYKGVITGLWASANGTALVTEYS